MSKMQNSKDTGSAKKSGILSYLKLCFEENLQPPHKIEGICLMDLSLISDVNFVKNQMGNVRASVEGSLTNPYIDLMCKCCRDSTRILKTMPDVAIAFKLLLEAGETMNIYDWLQVTISSIKKVYYFRGLQLHFRLSIIFCIQMMSPVI